MSGLAWSLTYWMMEYNAIENMLSYFFQVEDFQEFLFIKVFDSLVRLSSFKEVLKLLIRTAAETPF